MRLMMIVATVWDGCCGLYRRASPAVRIAVAALLFAAFVSLLAYVNVSAYLDKAARARSASFGPRFIPRPVTIRPPATAPDPGPIPAPVNRTLVPSPPDPTPSPPAPRAPRPGAGRWPFASERDNTVRWIRGDRE